jgi:hypothetical protein
VSETRYPTPDGGFMLIVDRSTDTIGFDGFYWQMAIDMLPRFRIDPPVSTPEQLLEALVDRRLVLVVSRFDDSGDSIRGVWITHDPAAENAARDEGETLEFRYWDGTPCRLT